MSHLIVHLRDLFKNTDSVMKQVMYLSVSFNCSFRRLLMLIHSVMKQMKYD